MEGAILELILLSDQKVIAEIEIKGEAKEMGIPVKLPVQKRYLPEDPAGRDQTGKEFYIFRYFPAS